MEKRKSTNHAILPREGGITNLSMNILATNTKKEPTH